MAPNGKKKTEKQKSLPFIEPNAAGIDIGANEIYVAVPEERDIRPVRKFATFTEDLHALADWLVACSIKTVAMESTGVYWIALFQILERRGLEVCLVNARHVKGVPGRKTDIQDCQWLQYLPHGGIAAGLLPARGSGLCASQYLAPSRQPAQGCLGPGAAHAKGPHSNEPPVAQCDQRHYRGQRVGHYRCHPLGRTRTLQALRLVRRAHQSQPPGRGKKSGGRLPTGTSPLLATGLGKLPAFSAPDGCLRRAHRDNAQRKQNAGDQHREEGFEFLGFAFRWQRSHKGGDYVHTEPSATSRARLREAIRKLTPRKTTWRATPEVITEINAVVRGWGNYFALGHYGDIFEQTRRFTAHRLRQWLWRKHGNLGGKYKRWPDRRLFEAYGLYQLPKAILGANG